jgi:hypothetical protein
MVRSRQQHVSHVNVALLSTTAVEPQVNNYIIIARHSGGRSARRSIGTPPPRRRTQGTEQLNTAPVAGQWPQESEGDAMARPRWSHPYRAPVAKISSGVKRTVVRAGGAALLIIAVR